ncbi:hypothetical protein V1514DRAFT_206768 [Lipomyces japonicus]|uniref:uncharacterized protein n=1 Tax=Lipomyces japonicus TaxID=56871 RepID=UPI0034CE0A4B
MTKYMRAVDIKNGKGNADALFVNPKIAKPTSVGANEVLVKVHAFGLNRMDILQREGRYPLPPHVSKTLGVEFSGTIVIAGDQVQDFKPDDRVFGLAYGGAYAEYIVASASLLFAYRAAAADDDDHDDHPHAGVRSPSFSFVSAAGVPEVWFTAAQALLRVAELDKTVVDHGTGNKIRAVLIHAGASGVGIAAVQLAHALLRPYGGKVFATVSTDDKARFVENVAGADHAINYRTTDFVNIINQQTDGHGADLIIDFVGQDYFNRNLDVAAVDGRIVLLATLSGAIASNVNIGTILRKRLRIEGSTLRSRSPEYQAELRDLVDTFVIPRLETGEFVNPVDKIFSWHKIVQAHKYMESNQSKGKIIAVVDDGGKDDDDNE